MASLISYQSYTFYNLSERALHGILLHCDRKSFLTLLLLSKEWNRIHFSHIHQFLKNRYAMLVNSNLPGAKGILKIERIFQRWCFQLPRPTIREVKRLDLAFAIQIASLYHQQLPKLESSNMTIPKILGNLEMSTEEEHPNRLIQTILYFRFQQLGSAVESTSEFYEKFKMAFQSLRLDSRMYLGAKVE